MNKILIVLGIVVIAPIVLAAILFSWGLGTYNSLISQEQTVSNNWATVETQYQRRFDLIPGLVNATKGYLKQEQKVFGDIAEARTRYTNAPANSTDKVEATNQIEGALARLMVIMENYPVLKSDATVRGLTDELAGTENRIQIARERYNGQVQIWNTKVKTVPTSLIAGMFGFKEKAFFESANNANQAVPVNLE